MAYIAIPNYFVGITSGVHAYSLLTKLIFFCLLTVSKVVVVVFMWSHFILVKLTLTAMYLHQKSQGQVSWYV